MVLPLRLPGVTSVEWVRRPSNCTSRRRRNGPADEGRLYLSPHGSGRLRNFRILHSTVGLGASSAGGAMGTASMTSGAGTTLRVFC